jgi:hypothetical protein
MPHCNGWSRCAGPADRHASKTLDAMARLLNALLDISKLDSGSVLRNRGRGLTELFDTLRERRPASGDGVT